jgi:hypothetical protein
MEFYHFWLTTLYIILIEKATEGEAGTWKFRHGGGTYGIRVGVENRQWFFNPSWKWIDVEIAREAHTFRLTPGFWRHCPEFRDSGAAVIQEWLRRNNKIPWPCRRPPRFTLEVVGEQWFRLEPEPAHDG